MPYEIWAVDRGAGEAVLRNQGDWYLLSIHQQWKPVPLTSEAVSRWCLSSQFTPLESRHETLIGAAIVARSLCLEELAPGPIQAAELEPLLSEMEELLRLIEEYCGPLDRYFGSHGCAADLSFDLALQALREVSEGLDRAAPEEVGPALFAAAQALYRQHRAAVGAMAADPVLPSLGERRLEKGLVLLSLEELSCVRLWADSAGELMDLVRMLRISRKSAKYILDRAARKLECSVPELKGQRLAEACRREILGRLPRGTGE